MAHGGKAAGLKACPGKTVSGLIFRYKAVESAPLTGIGGKRRIRRGLTAACSTRVMRETPCSRKIWKETR